MLRWYRLRSPTLEVSDGNGLSPQLENTCVIILQSIQLLCPCPEDFSEADGNVWRAVILYNVESVECLLVFTPLQVYKEKGEWTEENTK